MAYKNDLVLSPQKPTSVESERFWSSLKPDLAVSNYFRRSNIIMSMRRELERRIALRLRYELQYTDIFTN